MFTLTYADADDHWVIESDIALEYALEQIKTMRPHRKWLMLQTYDASHVDGRSPECLLWIDSSTKNRYHVTFDDRRLATQWRGIAIDATRWKSRETVFIQGYGVNASYRIYETVEFEELKRVVELFFAEKRVSDTEIVVWKATY